VKNWIHSFSHFILFKKKVFSEKQGNNKFNQIMNSTTGIISMKNKRQQHHHGNKVSFTEEDFMDRTMRDIFDNTIDVPPADRKIFDYYPEDIYSGNIEYIKSSQHYLTQSTLPLCAQRLLNIPNMIDDDDAIKIPSLDENLKWSPQNPMVTIPNIGHAALAHAVSTGEASIHGAQLSILEELKRMTYQRKTKAIKQVILISEEEITDRDVICERGGKSNRHAGTKKYRGMIERFKPQYQSLSSKTAKTNLSRKIISQIQENGGRFLKKDEKSQKYFVLSAVETTKKVSQAMREKKVLKWTEDSASPKAEKKGLK